MNKNTRKGFTLIEMLIVVAIIGILASIVVVGIGPAQKKGRDSRRAADLREVQTALELYYNKEGEYPGNVNSWSDLKAALINADIGVSNIPVDPNAGVSYIYGTNSTQTSYVLKATLDETGSALLNSSLRGNQPLPDGTVDCGVATVPPAAPSQIYCIGL